jgi:hypothetical protein
VLWAKAHGLQQVERQRRGGFVECGWTLLSTAEINYYRAVDGDGREHRIMASYRADLLGLRLFTLAELRDPVEPGKV